MGAEVIAAIIAAVGAIGLGAFNYANGRKTNAENLKLAEKQNEWNAAQVDKQNEYNSPSNQLQRLQDAGINPSLYYGGGNVISSGNQETVAQSANLANQQFNPLDIDMSAISNVGQSIVQSKQLKLESQKVSNETAQTNSAVSLNNAQINNLVKDGVLKDTQAQNLKASSKLIAEQTLQVKANTDLIGVETANRLIDAYWKDDQYSAELRKVESEVFKNEQEALVARQKVQNLITDNKLTETEIEINGERVKLMKQENGLVSFEIDTMNRYIERHKGERDLGCDIWLTRYAQGINAATSAEVDRRNASTNEQNAATNKRNAKTNEKNAETNKYNANTNRYSAIGNILRKY